MHNKPIFILLVFFYTFCISAMEETEKPLAYLINTSKKNNSFSLISLVPLHLCNDADFTYFFNLRENREKRRNDEEQQEEHRNDEEEQEEHRDDDGYPWLFKVDENEDRKKLWVFDVDEEKKRKQYYDEMHELEKIESEEIQREKEQRKLKKERQKRKNIMAQWQEIGLQAHRELKIKDKRKERRKRKKKKGRRRRHSR